MVFVLEAVNFREALAKELVSNPAKAELVAEPSSELIAAWTDVWIKEHRKGLVEVRERLLSKFKWQCAAFVLGLLPAESLATVPEV